MLTIAMELRQSLFLQGITEPEPEPTGSEVSESAALDLSSSLSHQQLTTTDRYSFYHTSACSSVCFGLWVSVCQM